MGIIAGEFNDSFVPIADGVANVVKNYALWLPKNQIDSYVVTPDYPGYMDNEKFEVLRYQSIPVPLRYPYRAGMSALDITIKKRLGNIDFDLVHAHSPFSSGKLALKMAHDKGIPIIASFHSKYYDDFKDALKSDMAAKILLKMTMEFFEKVDYVWTMNQSTLETLREYGFKGDVDIVPNGIDFLIDYSDKHNIKDASKDKINKLEFLFVGQHIWHKNLRLLADSLHYVKNAGIEFHMTMVGEGNAAEALKRYVRKLGMDDDFTFTGRINDREKIRAIYSKADLFIFPSLYDTFALVVREAAAEGCPSIVIEGSNAAENIVDGYNGFLGQNDSKLFAKSICEAVYDRSKLYEAGINARNTLYRSWDSVVEEVAQRYKEIIRIYNRVSA